jgi:hypothetical protein
MRVPRLNYLPGRLGWMPDDIGDIDWSDAPELTQRAAKPARCPTKAEDGSKPPRNVNE